jgi:uncharacterized protein YneF (UPF0154 family)
MNQEIINTWLWVYVALLLTLLIGLIVDFYYYNKRMKILKGELQVENKKDRLFLKWLHEFK